MHPCCPHSSQPASHRAPAPVCGWLPSEKAPPEAKADVASTTSPNGALVPVFVAEAAIDVYALTGAEPPFEPPPGGTRPAPSLPSLSVRC